MHSSDTSFPEWKAAVWKVSGLGHKWTCENTAARGGTMCVMRLYEQCSNCTQIMTFIQHEISWNNRWKNITAIHMYFNNVKWSNVPTAEFYYLFCCMLCAKYNDVSPLTINHLHPLTPVATDAKTWTQNKVLSLFAHQLCPECLLFILSIPVGDLFHWGIAAHKVPVIWWWIVPN